MTSALNISEEHLPRAGLRWLQFGWLAVVGATALLYLVGLIVLRSEPRTLCLSGAPGCTEASAAAALAAFGLPPTAIVGLAQGISDFGVPIACLLMAGFLFWQRPDRAITLAVSAMLAMYGSAVNTGLVSMGLGVLGLQGFADAYYLVFEGLLYFALLTFPNGRFVPRWTWLALPAALMSSALLLITGVVRSGDSPPTFILVFFFAFGIQVYRYRRLFTPIERQQSKWVLAGLSAFFVNAVVYVVVVEPANRVGVEGLPYLVLFAPLNMLLVLALPATLLIASLRYRLWDIDVLIRRTLIYSALTALLALIYFGAVVVLQSLLQALTGQRQSALVTVLSTLAIAALFVPLRGRLQAAIDRRFYRRKYDASQIIAAFGHTLRAEVELDRVTTQLIDTVDASLQPVSAGLWLKPPVSSGRRTGQG